MAVLALAACAAPPAEDTVAQDSRAERCGWSQWGQNAAHDGVGCVRAQPLATQRAHEVIDPFVDQEVAEAGFGPDGPLLTHYQVPLTDGDDVFVMRKTGTFPSCDPPGSHTPAPCGLGAFDQQTWTERALRWHHGELKQRWVFAHRAA